MILSDKLLTDIDGGFSEFVVCGFLSFLDVSRWAVAINHIFLHINKPQ